MDTITDILNKGLAQIALQYTPFSEACKADVEKFAKIEFFNKNTIAVKEGQYSSVAYFIITGSARAYYIKNGKEITDWLVFDDDFICAVNSLFLSVPSPDYIQFTEESTVLSISKESIDLLCNKHHDFERLLRIIVTKQMLRLQQRIVSIQFETPHQRYNNLILQYPSIENKFALGHIASFLGITPETLSRLRALKK